MRRGAVRELLDAFRRKEAGLSWRLEVRFSAFRASLLYFSSTRSSALFTLCASNEPRDSLPRAHACICTVDVPEYSSYKSLRRALHTSATLGSIGFDDAAVTADGGDDVDEVPPTPRA